MPDPLLALPQFASPALTPEGNESGESIDAPVVAPVVVDFDATEPLSDSQLRSIALESIDTRARLAACWRLMIRGQAIPQIEPTEGMRGLTLLNLATVQNLEILAVLLELDPSPSVRAQAAVLMWRVARDRDRVVSLLASRLQQDPSETVIISLLTLEPPLPFALISRALVDLTLHASPDVRTAARSFGLDHRGQIDGDWLRSLATEHHRGVRTTLLTRWAYSPHYAALLDVIPLLPRESRAILDFLHDAGRVFPLSSLEPLISNRLAARQRAAHRRSPWPVSGVFANDGDFLDCVLRIAQRPFSVDDRRRLVAITGRVPAGSVSHPSTSRTRRAKLPQKSSAPLAWWTSDALLRGLEDSYTSNNAPDLDAEEQSWVPVLRETLESLDVDDSSDDDFPGESDALRRLIAWMSGGNRSDS